MNKYQCTLCGYIFDEERGCPDQRIFPETNWEDVPEDFVCPECGAGKDVFELVNN